MDLGLVLEGGAMRGLFTAGVLDVMMESDLSFDGCVGVSAGAAFGCNIKSRQIGRVLRYNLDYCNDPRYCSIRSLLKTGDLFGAKFCYDDLPNELDPFDNETYDSNPMAFYAVCTDVETGKAIYPRCDRASKDTFTYIQASASMPFVSRPVSIGGMTLLDGGIADPIPLQFFQEKGYKRNVVVLTQPRDYVKSPVPSSVRMLLLRYPKVADTMLRRHLIYKEEQELAAEAERKGEAFVICPESPLPIGRVEHDPNVIRQTYELGRSAAESRMDELKRFVSLARIG
ncbi:MAG: patatin family protein [Oscillospiraceae bacterium]|nr:patatin family protein [Oscillospiraceae bacterium]